MPQVGQNRGEERDKQVYTTQVHNLDTKLPCPGYEIKHGTRSLNDVLGNIPVLVLKITRNTYIRCAKKIEGF